MKKRILSFVLILAMLFTMGTISLSANAQADSPAITLESVTAESGQEVSVKVLIENNPGIWGVGLKISYDKTALTLISVDNGDFYQASEWTKGNLASAVYILSYEASGFDDITTQSGILATLNFKVSDTASAGDYEVTASYNPGDIINVNFDDIDFTITNGKVTVKEESSFVPVYGNTLILDETIGIRYLFRKEDLAAVGKEVTASYSTNGTDYIDVPFSDYTEKNITYASIVVPPSAAKSFTDTIFVKLSCNETADEYSIKEVCESILNNPSGSSYLVELAKAILNYGAAAQIYFQYHTDNLAANPFYEQSAPDFYDQHDPGTSGNPLQIVGASLILRDRIYMNFWIQPETEVTSDLVVLVNGKETEYSLVKNSGSAGYYTVAVPVPANKMQEPYSVCIKNTAGELLSNVYTHSIGSYCYLAEEMSGSEDSLTILCKKITAYIHYANEYIEYLNNKVSLGENEVPPMI